MLNNLFRTRGPAQPDYRYLQVDMHAHWLPGIDDGAQTMEDSLHMIRTFRNLGFRHLIATPHVMADFYPNTPEIIREKLAQVRAACAAEKLDISLDAAAEYMIDEEFELHGKEYGLLTLPGKRVLVELGFYAPPNDIDGVLFRLQAAGYRPVIAHPERYPFYHGKLDAYRSFHERGMELQVNLLSLSGHYGSRVRSVAHSLLEAGLVSLLGTDAHRMDHLDELGNLPRDRKYQKMIAKLNFGNAALASA